VGLIFGGGASMLAVLAEVEWYWVIFVSIGVEY
jgi:hypothetical protein